MSESLAIAKQFLNKEVDFVIDRPLGSKHPKFDMIYPINYGYVPDVTAPDGEELDAYVLDEKNEPLEKGRGTCVAIIHRLNDDDDKLIVSLDGKDYSDEEIESLVSFQESWFEHQIIR